MASVPYITSHEQLMTALTKWRNFSMNTGYLNARAVAESLETDSPLVEAYQPYPGAWKVHASHRLPWL